MIGNARAVRARSAPRRLRRIGFVSPRYVPFVGGVETHVANLATRMVAAGYHVEVLTQHCGAALPTTDEVDGVLVRRFPMLLPLDNLAVAPRLWTYLAQHAACYDIIHAHSYHALPALAGALTNRRPLVFTPHYHGTGHSPVRSLLHRPYRPLGATIFRRARRVICVSAAEAALVRRHFPVVETLVSVVHNGVDVAALQAAAPYALDHSAILSVGRLEDYKNVHVLIEALQHLHQTFVLYVIGDGPARPRLEMLATRCDVAHRVRFLGRVDTETLHRWFRSATAFVSLSAHEAFGITLAEAAVAGAALVASDIPAHREVQSLLELPGCPLVALPASARRVASAIEAAIGAGSKPVGSMAMSLDMMAERTLQVYELALRDAHN
jgi:glycosyltransferase involved in cell wall biosynthesis